MEKSSPHLATLFTLRAEEVVAGDYVELRRSSMKPIFVCGPTGCEAVAPLNDRFSTPVTCIRSFPKPTTEPINTPWDEPIHGDCFIAVEPALAEMLSAPYKAEVEQLRLALKILQDWRRWYNNLPLWKRVWLVMTRDCPTIPEVIHA